MTCQYFPPRTAVLASTLLAILAMSSMDSMSTCPYNPSPQEIRSGMLGAIETLWDGTPEMKRGVTENAELLIRGLEASPLIIEPASAESVVESLRTFLQIERDDWITSRLLESLSSSSSKHLRPLFRDALESASVNLRWQAIQWYVYTQDQEALPGLEHAWPNEDRPWVQVDLIAALASHGSTAFVQDFLRLTRAKDWAISLAAIEALGELGDSRALPRLLELAAHGGAEHRVEALRGLDSWPDSVDALQVVLESTRAGDSGIQATAIRTLGSFEDPSAAERLVEIVRQGGEGSTRRIAIEQLEEMRHPDVVPVLLAVLQETLDKEDLELRQAALRALYNHDDPGALPGLLSLDHESDNDGHPTISEVIAYLSRDRSSGEEREFTIVRTSCSFRGSIDPEDPDALRVLPPPGRRSIRCWQGPGIPGDPAFLLRIPAGLFVGIEDYFESPDELWVLVGGLEGEDCWVPRRLLVSVGEGYDFAATDPGGLSSVEFDLPAIDLQSIVAVGLIETGLLFEIDPGDEVVGVSLMIDPEDSRSVEALARAYELDGSILQEQILSLARDLAPRYRADPSLGPLLDFALKDEDEAD